MDGIETGASVEATTEAPQVSESVSLNDKIADVVKANVKKFSDEKQEEVKPVVAESIPREGKEDVKPEKATQKEVKDAKPVTAKDEKPEVVKAPNGWTKEEKAEFEKLSEPAKKAILRSEGEKESAFTQKSMELAKVSRTLEKNKEAIEAHEYVKQVAEKSGAPTPRHFIERMVEAQEQSVRDPVGFVARITDQNPIGFVKALMQRYDIDVRQLAAGRDDLAFDTQTHQQQTEMQRIQRENAEMRQYFENQRQQQEQAQVSQQQQQYDQAVGSIADAMEQFYADKSEGEREAATPYLEHAVRVVMAEAGQKGEQINSYGELIRRAHAKALRLNDSYNPPLPQRADYASSRAVSPHSRGGSATGVPTTTPKGSFNDMVAQIARNNLRKYS
jgi:hypothetical protein